MMYPNRTKDAVQEGFSTNLGKVFQKKGFPVYIEESVGVSFYKDETRKDVECRGGFKPH